MENNINNIEEKDNSTKNNDKNNTTNSTLSGLGKKAYNTGKEFLNLGMYGAEGRNFDTRRNYNRNNINNTRKEDYDKNDNENSTIINIQEDDIE